MTLPATVLTLETKHGTLRFPCFLPVTTFGGKFPLDDLLRPYLPRFAQGVMVSHFYAQKMTNRKRPDAPVFIDSGGFASLFEGSRFHDFGEIAVIRTKDGTEIHPADVLAFQEKHADIGATLDFLIPPNIDNAEAVNRQELTMKNAQWAITHRSNPTMKLFASVQAWDRDSARRIMDILAPHPFDGFALGGMVPRLQTPKVIFEVVSAIREVEPHRTLHVFGMGSPRMVHSLFKYGVDSVDSSSYLHYAASKKYLRPSEGEYVPVSELEGEPSAHCGCAICRQFGKAYLGLEGELNGMALALHNLQALQEHIHRMPAGGEVHSSSGSPSAAINSEANLLGDSL